MIGLLLFFFRRIVQDKEKIHWREDTPTMPETAAATTGRARRLAAAVSDRRGPVTQAPPVGTIEA